MGAGPSKRLQPPVGACRVLRSPHLVAINNAFPTRSTCSSLRGAIMELVLEGSQGKTLTVQGDVIRIEKGGLLTGKREKTIPIRNVTSVEVKKPGGFAGFIQFSIAGGKARDSSYSLSGGAVAAALGRKLSVVHRIRELRNCVADQRVRSRSTRRKARRLRCSCHRSVYSPHDGTTVGGTSTLSQLGTWR